MTSVRYILLPRVLPSKTVTVSNEGSNSEPLLYSIYLSDSTLIEAPLGSPPQTHTDSFEAK